MSEAHKEIQLVIKNESGEQLQLSLAANATVYELKLRIYERWNDAMPHKQQLHIGDVELSDFALLSLLKLNSGDLIRMSLTDDDLPTLDEFRSTEELRIDIQRLLNQQATLEDYDELIRLLVKERNTRVDRLLVDICNEKTEFKEEATRDLFFTTGWSPKDMVVLKANATDTIRMVKMLLFARFRFETSRIRFEDDLADDLLVVDLPLDAPFGLQLRDLPVIREAKEDDSMASCFAELLEAVKWRDKKLHDLEVEILRGCDDLRRRLKLLRSLEKKMAELKSTEPTDFRVHVTDQLNAGVTTTVGAKADEPLFVFKFRLARLTGASNHYVWFSSKERPLENDMKSLADYAVKNEDVLEFVQREAPGLGDFRFVSYHLPGVQLHKMWDLCEMAAERAQLSHRISSARFGTLAISNVLLHLLAHLLPLRLGRLLLRLLRVQRHNPAWTKAEKQKRTRRICASSASNDPRQLLFLPCVHLVVCSEAPCCDLQTCPVDGRPIKQKVQARLS
ncbi:hypothetical protein M3Y99_01566900 [Aphelenchoides fujianensis]|nr:hypothetical protein M3Y99_01566900 [Aphelenchoides fujianensis]